MELNPTILSWENICIAKNGSYLKLDQVLIAQIDHIVIKSAKPYLATLRAIGHYGKIIYEAYTLVTFIYEKSKSGNITHYLSKME